MQTSTALYVPANTTSRVQGRPPPQRLPTPEVAAKRSEGMAAADALRTLAFAHRQARNDCRAAAGTATLYGARSCCLAVKDYTALTS